MDRVTKALMCDRLLDYLVKACPMELPDTHFDGTPITDVKEVAAVMNIPVWEAAARMGQKDVFTGMAGMQMVNGLSGGRPSRRDPVVERAKRVSTFGSKPALAKKKKRKRTKVPGQRDK